MNQQDFVLNLSEFYKHCLNVCGSARPENEIPLLWNGWMRCKITPYLIDNIIVGQTGLKNNLIYTIQDYMEHINISSNNIIVTIKCQMMIDFINNISEANLLTLIDNNKILFTDKEECAYVMIFNESFNIELINKQKLHKKIKSKINNSELIVDSNGNINNPK